MKPSFILAAIFTLFIWSNSLINAEQSSIQSGWVTDIFDQTLRFIGIRADEAFLSLLVRKLAHFTEFFLLGVIWFIYFKQKQLKIYKVQWIILGVAVMDEFIQLFVDGRSGSIIDVMIDLAGGLVGYYLCDLLDKKLIKHDKKIADAK